jgi:diguanylate cyclase (GGDEF)-like protein
MLMPPALVQVPPAASRVPYPALTYRFHQHDVRSGLRSPAAPLAQDAAGFLWAGTDSGVYRYNGRRWDHFGQDQGLPEVTARALACGAGRRLWVVTVKGTYFMEDGRFRPVSELGLPQEEPHAIAADGNAVYLTGSFGTWTWGPGAGPPRRLALPPGSPSVVVPQGNALWATGTDKAGLWLGRLQDGQWALRRLPGPSGECPDHILVEPGGRIWARSNNTLFRLDRWDAPVEDLHRILPARAPERADLALDGAGRLWTNTGAGLLCVDRDHAWILGKAQGLPSEDVYGVTLDREGNLWCSSLGVQRLLGQGTWGGLGSESGLPPVPVWCTLRDRRGVLWAGTTAGAYGWTGNAWRLQPETRGRAVQGILEDAQGGLWLGGAPDGRGKSLLLHRHPAAEAFAPVACPPKVFPSRIIQDASGRILFGAFRDGVLVIPEGADQAHPLPAPRKAGWGRVQTLSPTPWRGISACSSEGFAIQEADGAWSWLDAASGLPDSFVYAAAWHPQEAQAWLWLPTARTLVRIALENGAWAIKERLGPGHPMTADGLVSLRWDRDGSVWAATSVGLKRFRDGHTQLNGAAAGLLGEDVSEGTGFEDADGAVWWPLSAGLARWNRRHDPGLLALPDSEVLAVQDARGRELAPGADVPWDRRSLRLAYRTASLSCMGQDRFQVRLLGLETAWRDTESAETLFAKLPAGSYRFEVRSGREGEDGFGKAAAFPFRVLAPWWQSPWFLALLALAGAGGVQGLVRWRTWTLRRRTGQLTLLVDERTAALTEALGELAQANEALQEAALLDPLTGLRNRRFAQEVIPGWIRECMRGHHPNARRDTSSDILFFLLDLDFFKAVNDTHGHGVGDQVLRQSARALTGSCRSTDLVIRWGGEEFLVVARAPRTQAPAMAEALCAAIRKQDFGLHGGLQLTRTVSVGWAPFPFFPGTPEAVPWPQVVELADQALYAVKHAGRDNHAGLEGVAEAPGGGTLTGWIGEGQVRAHGAAGLAP